MSQSVYRTYRPICPQGSGPSESRESEYDANNDNAVLEPWLVSENTGTIVTDGHGADDYDKGYNTPVLGQ